MEGQDSRGGCEGNIRQSDALAERLVTSRAVLIFFKGLKRGSVFLVFFISSMISAMVKSSSIITNDQREGFLSEYNGVVMVRHSNDQVLRRGLTVRMSSGTSSSPAVLSLSGFLDTALALLWFEGLKWCRFVALDGEHLVHFLLLERVAVVLDEGFEVLHVFQRQQRVEDLLVDDGFAALEQLVEARPLELLHPASDVLLDPKSTFCRKRRIWVRY